MPLVEKPHRKRIHITKKMVFIALGVVVAAIVGAYVFLVPTPSKAFENFNDLSATGDYGLAKFDLNLARLKAFSEDDRMLILSGLTSLAFKTKDYAAAEQYMQEQEAYFKNSYEFAASRADLYEVAGDKKQAIFYYKQALDLLSKQKTGIRTISDKYLQTKINQLEGK